MNNEQIDKTSYYELPGGGQLEDFIAEYELSFGIGSALKYLFRAGNKDGESVEKDRAKARHFIEFEARRAGCEPENVERLVKALAAHAQSGKWRSIHNGLDVLTKARITMHYRHAIEKHPYFCDCILADYDGGPQTDLAVVAMKEELETHRSIIEQANRCGILTPEALLLCEYAEVMEAYARRDYYAAVEECHDCIAVLLRLIDVLEGRQRIGKFDNEAKAATE